MNVLWDSVVCYPVLRFALRYCHPPDVRHGPRVSYIQSVYLIEEGEGRLRFEDSVVDLFPGVHVFLPAGKVHTWETDSQNPAVFRCVFFEWNYQPRPELKYRNDFLPELSPPIRQDYVEYAQPFPLAEYLVLDTPQDWLHLYNGLSSRVEVFDAFRVPTDLQTQGHFLLFLDYVLNLTTESARFVDPRIHHLVKRMNEASPEFKVRIDEWAIQLGLSRSYFHQLFRNQTGYTPNSYWNLQRINHTIDDLLDTTKAITDIAEGHGFASIHTYSKLFRKIMGVSPSEYRDRNRLGK